MQFFAMSLLLQCIALVN